MCCLRVQGYTSSSGQCVPLANTQCTSGVQLACATNANCAPGKVCCGVYDPWQGYASTRCADSCIPESETPPYDVPLCNPNAPTDECIKYHARCAPSSSLPGYYACAWAP
jgi:hypothetical protein